MMDSALPSPSSKIQELVKGQDEGEGKDIIRKLPDSILHYILSFLPTKDAVRTSILSTKWRYMWTGMLNFDFDDELCFWKTNNKKFELGTCLLNLVDRVLLHDAAHIQKLRLSLLFMMHVSAFRSYLWIYSVIKHNVQELDLCLPIRTTILLPPSLFTSKSLCTHGLRCFKDSEFCLLLRHQDLTSFICYIFG